MDIAEAKARLEAVLDELAEALGREPIASLDLIER